MPKTHHGSATKGARNGTRGREPFPGPRPLARRALGYGAPKVSVSRGVPSLACASEDHSHSASVPVLVSASP